MKIVLCIDILLGKNFVALKTNIREWGFTLMQTNSFAVAYILITLFSFCIVH